MLHQSQSHDSTPARSSPASNSNKSSKIPVIPSNLFLPPAVPTVPHISRRNQPVQRRLPRITPRRTCVCQRFPAPLRPIEISRRTSKSRSINSTSSSNGLLLLFYQFWFFFYGGMLLVLGLVRGIATTKAEEQGEENAIDGGKLSETIRSTKQVTVPFSGKGPISTTLKGQCAHTTKNAVHSELPVL